ncbi:hypothetical protein C4K21_3260 [Pseudomonas chlororaphis subsp. aurantiaca]|nr:hypothetical protein C4K21_3260 [Pseudomonas chlororaphis subsp. aurantiaca]
MECLSITAATTKPQDNTGEGLKVGWRFGFCPHISKIG